MRFPPSPALLASILFAGAASAVGDVNTHRPIFTIQIVEWHCDPETDPDGCVHCDFHDPLRPCRPIASVNYGCVPNTVEPRNLRPSNVVDNCVPQGPDPEDFPEPLWGLPVWNAGDDEVGSAVQLLDKTWDERVAPLLP